MRLIRFLDEAGHIGYASRTPDGDFALDGEIWSEFSVSERRVSPAKLLAPIEPTQIIGIGLNYRRHATEIGAAFPKFPVVFLKFLGALQHPSEPIFLPQKLASEQVDFEAELAVVIGRDCKNATRETALDFVLGYTVANDVSARDWQIQNGGTQWNRGKSFDSFCPLGPVLTLKDEIPDPNNLAITTILNGAEMQNSNTADMIFDVPAIIGFLSSDSTLRAGTIILTGTPEGVGMARDPKVWLRDGDQLSIEIENIGVLSNPVKGAARQFPASD